MIKEIMEKGPEKDAYRVIDWLKEIIKLARGDLLLNQCKEIFLDVEVKS